MTTTYSAFFSSGLLAPHHAFLGYSSAYASTGKDGYYNQSSPAHPSSPMPLPDDSDIEIDDMDLDGRGTTPTPESRSSTGTNPSKFLATELPLSATTNTASDTTAAGTTQQRPRLRKRRSSLTVAASPMSAIRSPARTANVASQVQRHLSTPLRARSGSVGCGTGGELFGNIVLGNAATEGTSLVGRMRSGSVGGGLRPRRGVRRINSVPAAAPPPTAPLPALPGLSCLQLPRGADYSGISQPPHSAPLFGTMRANTNMNSRAQRVADATMKKGRERAFSITNADTIDEEMKEN